MPRVGDGGAVARITGLDRIHGVERAALHQLMVQQRLNTQAFGPAFEATFALLSLFAVDFPESEDQAGAVMAVTGAIERTLVR